MASNQQQAGLSRYSSRTAARYLILLSLLLSPTVFAASALSDSELATVGGAGVIGNSQNQALPQQPQDNQQVQQTAANVPPTPPPDLDGMQQAPQVFVILQSSAEVKTDRHLQLSHDVQSGAKMLNMENAIGSDVVAGNNLFQGGTLLLEGSTTAIDVNQGNDIAQLHRSQGALQSSLTGHYYESTLHRVDQSESFNQNYYLSVDQLDQQSIVQLIEHEWGVTVDPINFSSPQISEESLVTLLDPEKIYLINPIGIDGTATGLFGEEYGVDAYYSGLFVEGPRISIDRVLPYGANGEDLLIESTARLGLIDFGGMDIKVCFGAFGCTADDVGNDPDDTDINLGQIEILNLFDALALMDPILAPDDGIRFTSNGIVLDGMGSVYEDDHNLNSGFALVGSGRVQVLEPFSFHSSLDIDLEVETRLTLIFDLGDLDPLDFFPSINLAIPPEGVKLVDVSKHIPLITINGNDINEVVNGFITIPLGPGEVSAESNGPSEQNDIDSDTQLVTEMISTDVSQSSYSETYEHQLVVGGQMSGAEAELLSLSEGSLSVENTSLITLSHQTQQNIRVFNGVNAVSSVAANSINIGQLPTMRGNLGGMPQMSMKQHNQFLQQR